MMARDIFTTRSPGVLDWHESIELCAADHHMHANAHGILVREREHGRRARRTVAERDHMLMG